MKEQGEDNHGTGKKFLYSRPKRKDQNPNEYWETFAPKKKSNSEFDMEDVWSIKKNVTIGAPLSSGNLDKPAAFGGNSYYSRHSNVKFSGEETNTSLGTSTGLSGSTGNTPSWSHSSRSNYSYMDMGGTSSRQTADDRDDMTSSPQTARTVPNKSNSRMMQTGGVPGSYRPGGRTQKNNRSSGSSWMDF